MSRPARFKGDSGTGVLATTFGITIFLTLLMAASHVLLNLWVISSVDAVAYDAATDVATSGASDAEMSAATRVAIDRARQALGGYGDDVELSFSEVSDTRVVLDIRAPQLSLFPPGVARFFDPDGVTRRIIVRREPVAP